MAKDNSNFNLEIDESLNEIFDENNGNSFLALRKLRWNPNSDYRVDIRKWYTNSTGDEVAGKGVSFVTEEGPNNLIQALLKNDYGNTKDTLESIKDRDDFLVSVKEVLVKNNMDLDSIEVALDSEDGSETFYDPKNIL